MVFIGMNYSLQLRGALKNPGARARALVNKQKSKLANKFSRPELFMFQLAPESCLDYSSKTVIICLADWNLERSCRYIEGCPREIEKERRIRRTGESEANLA